MLDVVVGNYWVVLSFTPSLCYTVNNIYFLVYNGLIFIPLGSSVLVPGFANSSSFGRHHLLIHNDGTDPGGFEGDVLIQFTNIDLNSRWSFTNTFYKLEEEVIEWMKKMWHLKVIGPTLPSMYLDKRLEDDKDYMINLFEANNSEYMNWLNGKPKGSVVYVSFGSMAQLGPKQMEEIAWGLNDKAISLGVPVVAMPQWADQITNGKCLEDIWGVGVRVKADDKGMVNRDNLVSCIKEIMEGERGVVAQKNAKKWMDLAKEAISEGGSSDKDIDGFISELKH
ncbi:hypothetical protein Tco_1224009 [Tanacetum coccineum]